MTLSEASALRPGDRVELDVANPDPFGDPRTIRGAVFSTGLLLLVQLDSIAGEQLAPSIVTPHGIARLRRETS